MACQSWCYAARCARTRSSPSPAWLSASKSQVPSIYRKQTPTLREKYGFTDEEVGFSDLHIVSDNIDGERGYQIVLEHARTDELQQRCLKRSGMRLTCASRIRRLFTTITSRTSSIRTPKSLRLARCKRQIDAWNPSALPDCSACP